MMHLTYYVLTYRIKIRPTEDLPAYFVSTEHYDKKITFTHKFDQLSKD